MSKKIVNKILKDKPKEYLKKYEKLKSLRL